MVTHWLGTTEVVGSNPTVSDSEGESATSVTRASEAYCRGSHYMNIEYVFTILPLYKGEGNQKGKTSKLS